MNGFHSNCAELYITIKYRSSSILVINCQILADIWPFFDLVFVVRFCTITFRRDALISFKLCRTLYQCKIHVQVKFDIGNHLPNFGWVMALFRLTFCWFVDLGFHSITFAGMHWFYWKFDALILLKVCRRIYHCKIQVKFDIGNHPQNFGQVMALFRLSFCCWGKIQGKDIFFPQ